MISVLIISMMVATFFSGDLNPSLEDQVVAKRDKKSETVSTKQPEQDRNPSELKQAEYVESEYSKKAPVERPKVWNPRIFTTEIYRMIDSMGSLLKRYAEDSTKRELKHKKINDLYTNLTELETQVNNETNLIREKLMAVLALTVELEKLTSEENGKKKDSTETGKSERDEEVILNELKSLIKELAGLSEKIIKTRAAILEKEKEEGNLKGKEKNKKDIEDLEEEEVYAIENMNANKTKIKNYEREINRQTLFVF